MWKDISQPLYDAYISGEPMKAIATAVSPGGPDSMNIILVIDFGPSAIIPGVYIWSPFYNVTTTGWTDGIWPDSDRISYVPGHVDHEDFDISQLTVFNDSKSTPYFSTFYFNRTTLRLFPTDLPGGLSEIVPPVIRPPSLFPFARLGSTTLLNSTVVYLYHQLNETAFAEDKYDTVGSFWTSSILGLSLT